VSFVASIHRKYKDNWPEDQILILLQLGDGDISYLHMSSHLRSLLTHLQTFYMEVENFTKYGDKFGLVNIGE